MAGDLTAELSPTASFTIPPMATSFFPGIKPYSTLLSFVGPADYTATQGGTLLLARATATAV